MSLLLSAGAGWPSRASAAVISEVFLAGLPGSPTPNAVEVHGLNTVGRSAVDLVVIDASPFLGPLVRQVVTLPTTQEVLLVSDAAWPTNLWNQQISPAAQTTLAALGAASSTWKFTGSRTLLLYDRETNLVGGAGILTDLSHLLNNAVLLDALTFKRGGAAQARLDEPILDTAHGYAISRPLTDELAWAAPVIGSADSSGYLTATDPPYPLTPGRLNVPMPAHAPEPSAGLAVATLALFYALRRPIMVGYAR